ncbi:caspase-8 [Pangasianodon hypophthalmus]|uniref:caspase-8 n=1 Tax=Pangasianodon hypophthalmus TaxID=310915 RepID=UPI002307D080|nr:caspase-8 [Pangasianodon hypophthalmus]XP_034166790.2 caspase-8 [Pangasianodon hypophthalmus]
METVRKNKVFLIDTLSADASIVLQHVQNDNIITRRDYNNLNQPNHTHEQIIIKLLDNVTNKGNDACHKFLQMLEKEELQEIFPRLKELFTPDHTSHDPESPAKATEMGEYKMSRKPRGVCLIINNMDFGDPKKYRHGSDKDEESLKKVFEWLGFTVEVQRDQTAEQMKTILRTWSKENHKGDCFVCCILSHGTTDGVHGTDGGIVSREDIFSPFYGNSCRSLNDKPKVFFIQACRGRQLHPIVQVQADGHKEEIAGEEEEEEELETDAETVILDGADFFVARSTIKGYFSFRNSKSGSWFIQSLCEQLTKYCPEGEDINSILVRTNEEVSRRLSEIKRKEQNLIQDKKVKQMPIYNSTLRKRLVFKP